MAVEWSLSSVLARSSPEGWFFEAIHCGQHGLGANIERNRISTRTGDHQVTLGLSALIIPLLEADETTI